MAKYSVVVHQIIKWEKTFEATTEASARIAAREEIDKGVPTEKEGWEQDTDKDAFNSCSIYNSYESWIHR